MSETINYPFGIPKRDHYDLCNDCMMRHHDFFMEAWRKDIAGHTIDCFRCDLCGAEPKEKKKSWW
jgi:hypothetical protein